MITKKEFSANFHKSRKIIELVLFGDDSIRTEFSKRITDQYTKGVKKRSELKDDIVLFLLWCTPELIIETADELRITY